MLSVWGRESFLSISQVNTHWRKEVTTRMQLKSTKEKSFPTPLASRWVGLVMGFGVNQ